MVETRFRNIGSYLRTRIHQHPDVDSAAELGEKMGWASSYISGIINEQFRPSVNRLKRIAEFFGDDSSLLLELAGYLTPPSPDDEVVNRITQITNGLSRAEQVHVLEYAEFVRQRPVIIGDRARRGIIYAQLPSGEEVKVEMPDWMKQRDAEEIERIIKDALATHEE